MILKKILKYPRTPWVIYGGIFDSEKAEDKILELDSEIAKENFWKDKNRSQRIIKQKNSIENILNFFKETQKNLDNLRDLFKLALEENDNETISDCTKKISHIYNLKIENLLKVGELEKHVKCFQQ